MDGVFIFDDVINVGDYVITEILSKVTNDDLTKALIREDKKLRKLFYKNMSLDNFKILDNSLKTTASFTGLEKKSAQKKSMEYLIIM